MTETYVPKCAALREFERIFKAVVTPQAKEKIVVVKVVDGNRLVRRES